MPNNLFYNTGITTYVWLLSNNKAAHRKGKVQLIDANPLYRKLRRENIKGKEKANKTHLEVGKKVRQTIQELGGKMPENLPTEESVLKLERTEKKKLNPPKK